MSVEPVISWTVVAVLTLIQQSARHLATPGRGTQDHPRCCDVTTWVVQTAGSACVSAVIAIVYYCAEISE